MTEKRNSLAFGDSYKVAFNSLFKGKKAKRGKSKGIVCGFIETKQLFIMAILEGENGWTYQKEYKEIKTHKNNKKGYTFIDANDIIL